MISRTLLVLALAASVAYSVSPGSKGKCLCRKTRDRFGPTWAILDMQIYPPSPSCDKMEIVVNLQNGVQYCLNPRAKKVQRLVEQLQAKNYGPTVSPEDGSTDLWAPV